jgi:hypothetical protein
LIRREAYSASKLAATPGLFGLGYEALQGRPASFWEHCLNVLRAVELHVSAFVNVAERRGMAYFPLRVSHALLRIADNSSGVVVGFFLGACPGR